MEGSARCLSGKNTRYWRSFNLIILAATCLMQTVGLSQHTQEQCMIRMEDTEAHIWNIARKTIKRNVRAELRVSYPHSSHFNISQTTIIICKTLSIAIASKAYNHIIYLYVPTIFRRYTLISYVMLTKRQYFFLVFQTCSSLKIVRCGMKIT